jgi:serine/threonine protein kinase
MSLTPGSRLGPYEVESLLGSGGMGEVYRARDTRLDRTVAIKVLPTHVAADPDRRARLEREARAVAALNHPHICTLYDVGEARIPDSRLQNPESIQFLLMEYLEGETVAMRLEKGALPLDHALKAATEIADALDKAHHAGIVHRDLKPGNVMLTR